MSFFETAIAASGAIHDGLYGEIFKIEPRAVAPGPNGKPDPNARKIADPARPARDDLVAVWTDPHATAQPTNRTGHPVGEGGRFGDDKPTIDFETAALPYTVAIGDLVTRMKTGDRYAVADPGDDGFTRSTVALSAARGRAA